MPIQTQPILHAGVSAEALEVSWEGGQFVLIVAPRGLVACGVIDPSVMDRFGAAIAIARGTPACPLITAADLLAARIAEVTTAAAERGIKVGMAGSEALTRLG